MVKTIRVTDEEYQKIIEARKELARLGYGKLQSIEPERELDMDSFTLGAIAALGALALIYLLTKGNGGK